MKTIKILFTLLVLLVLGGGAFVWSGVYPIAADVPHWPITFQLMEMLRDRSIAAHAKGIQVPNLDDPKLLAEGAEHYGAMCTGCHLAPGMSDSEIRKGLYPQPPDLTKHNDLNPAEMFWTIKHGVKLSAMPAWGTTHDDQAIWNIVAFLQKLPGMTPEQYQAMTKSSGEEQGHHHHHGSDAGAGPADEHDHGETGEHHHGDAGASDEHEHGGVDQPDDHGGASDASGQNRQAEVRARGPDVMSFSLDATQHVFEKAPNGGTQRVIARAGHAEEIPKIRDHLRAIAAAFAARDFSGPTHIHGEGMPGLAELKAASSTDLTVEYRDVNDGGEITYRATSDSVRNAVHQWFDAQLSDHGHDATDHGTHAHEHG